MSNPFEKMRAGMRFGKPEDESSDRVGKKCLDDFSRFFKPPVMIRYGGHPLDEPFTLIQYSQEQFQADYEARVGPATKLTKENTREVAEDYAARYARDLQWLTQKGLVKEVPDQKYVTYRLTEEGRAFFNPRQ
jgi:hypothetical protein